MSTPTPPITEALEHYRITAENLWVVFTATPPHKQSPNRPPVLHSLFLADEGAKGRGQIERIESRDPNYLGSFSFLELQGALERLEGIPALDAPAEGLARLLPTKTFFIPVSTDEHFQVRQVRATTLAAAMKQVDVEHPGQAVGMAGTLEDVKELVAIMNHAISHQDFHAIETDRRGRIASWDANRVLFVKKNPDMVDRMVPYPDQEEVLK